MRAEQVDGGRGVAAIESFDQVRVSNARLDAVNIVYNVLRIPGLDVPDLPNLEGDTWQGYPLHGPAGLSSTVSADCPP